MSSPTDESGPPTEAVSQLIRDALDAKGNVSYEEVRRRLGPPESVETEPVANTFIEGQVDTLRTLDYAGLQVLVYDITKDEKSFLVRLSIYSTQYVTPEGLRVGASTDRVLDTLGPPTRRNQSRGEMIYQETEATPTSMVLRVREGRVVQIGWEFYFA